MTVHKLPKSAQDLYNHYRGLTIQATKVACPYHINTGLRGKNRALVGKGRPEEIEAAAEYYLGKFKMHANGYPAILKKYLSASGFGVDCSGFAAWMLNCLTLEKVHKTLPSCLAFPGTKRKLISRVRPYENISANLLTGPKNTITIEDINLIQPGDLIRIMDGSHVVIVSEVGLDKNEQAQYFKYMQSTISYGQCQGVEEDEVRVVNPSGYLLGQDWHDKLIYKALSGGSEAARVVRLKALQKI